MLFCSDRVTHAAGSS